MDDEQNLPKHLCPQPYNGAGTTRWPKDTELMGSAGLLLARVEKVPEFPVQWKSDHTSFMIRCVMMARVASECAAWLSDCAGLR